MGRDDCARAGLGNRDGGAGEAAEVEIPQRAQRLQRCDADEIRVCVNAVGAGSAVDPLPRHHAHVAVPAGGCAVRVLEQVDEDALGPDGAACEHPGFQHAPAKGGGGA